MSGKLLLVIAASVLLTGGACAQTVKIGVSGPLSGRSGAVGTSMFDGAELAAADINQIGGIMGMRIALVERDDQSDVERGVHIAQDLIGAEHVVATVGFADTNVALASQRLYQAAEIPVINAGASGPAITRQFLPPEYNANYIFRISASDLVQAVAIVREATRRGFKSPAILADATEGDRTGHEVLQKALEAARISPAADVTFNIGDTDMTTQLARINRSGADDRKSTRLNSSHVKISYAVFCLK